MLLRDSPMTRQGPKGARVPALPCIIHILRALVTTRLVRMIHRFDKVSNKPLYDTINHQKTMTQCWGNKSLAYPNRNEMCILTRSAMDAGGRSSDVHWKVTRGL